MTWIRPVKVGSVQLMNNLLLAPMEGLTDHLFRGLIRDIGGCAQVFTEFVPARALAEAHSGALKALRFASDQRPVGVQIYGQDPYWLVKGARMAEELGADTVDLNMGCPSKQVCKNSGGASLMRDPALCRVLVKAVREAVDIPFTIKMRTGWDASHRNAVDLAQMCEDEGVDAITIHWRTREDRYKGTRDISVIAEAVRRLSIPVFANGDIIGADSARAMFEETGCAGLMIGRGAVRNPWVFRQIAQALSGEQMVVISAEERRRVLLGFIDRLETEWTIEGRILGRVKKVARYFTEGIPQGRVMLRPAIFHSHSLVEVRDRIDDFFRRLSSYEAGDGGAFIGYQTD